MVGASHAERGREGRRRGKRAHRQDRTRTQDSRGARPLSTTERGREEEKGAKEAAGSYSSQGSPAFYVKSSQPYHSPAPSGWGTGTEQERRQVGPPWPQRPRPAGRTDITQNQFMTAVLGPRKGHRAGGASRALSLNEEAGRLLGRRISLGFSFEGKQGRV